MKIGYRRLAGKIRLDAAEKGDRGGWWEKRRAFIAALGEAGHEVLLLAGPAEVDLLVIEFGSNNGQFYGEDHEITRAAIEMHRGPVVYACDDPELFMPNWGCRKRMILWRNSLRSCTEGDYRAEMSVDFGSLLPTKELVDAELPKWVYAGRPDGKRADMIYTLLVCGAPLDVVGRPEEWAKYGIKPLKPPAQPERHAFYRKYVGMVGLADAKHRKLGWRTGRIQHAVAAGIPAMVMDGHVGYEAYPQIRKAEEAALFMKRIVDRPGERIGLVEKQRKLMAAERVLLGEALAHATR